MSTMFVLTLATAVVLVLCARLVVSALPFRRLARAVAVPDALAVALGVGGLALHCGSMFFPSPLSTLPGTGRAMSDINGMGAASMVWYAIPAALVVVGLRRQHPAALGVVALALTAVGITMYDGGSVTTHLAAIFISVVVLAGVMSALVLPPWGSRVAVGRR
jgi:hypothetical protein